MIQILPTFMISRILYRFDFFISCFIIYLIANKKFYLLFSSMNIKLEITRSYAETDLKSEMIKHANFLVFSNWFSLIKAIRFKWYIRIFIIVYMFIVYTTFHCLFYSQLVLKYMWLDFLSRCKTWIENEKKILRKNEDLNSCYWIEGLRT